VDTLIRKYTHKLMEAMLVAPPGPVMGGMDLDMVWNRTDKKQSLLEKVAAGLDISAILFAKPAEPYFSLIECLVERLAEGETALCPQDSENRTFLHEMPVVKDPSAANLCQALKHRKCAIIPGEGIVTYGTISPEQAYIVYSSVCFSLFVKAFVDYHDDLRKGRNDTALERIVMQGKDDYADRLDTALNHPPLKKGPFNTNKEVIEGICEAGIVTVKKKMVDSFFGNVSYRLNDTIFISQTTSSLDELEGCIDPCAMDDSRCTAITASSEYPAHRSVYRQSGHRAILHGHPRFSVIASMLCDERDTCENNGDCHIKCSRERDVEGIPILPGETGTGPHSIAVTLPPALADKKAAIIYGHGLFTTGRHDFQDAFQRLLDTEKACFEFYFAEIDRIGSS